MLALPALPRRIECFDISTIQGSETVASMVVCEDGRMRKADYRKFRIRGLKPARSESRAPSNRNSLSRAPSPESRVPRSPVPDDFAAMHEVVRRRYRKLLEEGGPFPDLILIDGGKGQLTAAYAALEALGLANLVAVGIAKKEELLFTRDRDEPIALAENDPALLLLQRIRDEAHRFAVTFHRKARSMRDLTSELDHVPGVGPAAPAHAADEVWQPRGRAPRDARRTGGGGRRQSRRCRSCVFRRAALTCTPLPDIDFAQVFIAFIVLLFSLTVHEIGACVDGGSARRSDGATARTRVAQPDGPRRSDRHGPVSAARDAGRLFR